MEFSTMAEVIKANREAGQHWFSDRTMAFFKSKIESELINGRWFVTSEEREGQRRYSVREVTGDDAYIHTVGEFWAYDTLAEALTQAFVEATA